MKRLPVPGAASSIGRHTPRDDSESFAAEILAMGSAEDPVAAPFHGGFCCPIDFDKAVENID